MDINRANYEEYFLLYADNELTDSEKAEVLIFVKNNKDLEAEFRMMLSTIAKPDTNIQLRDKTFLLKKDESFINQNNYEEIFVLYHDNELSEDQKYQAEVFLSQHTGLKEEFDLIGIARFSPDSTIVFSDKKNLYKKERGGRVVPLLWKVAAAAAFIGFILWVANFYFHQSNPSLVNNALSLHKNISPKIESPAATLPTITNKNKANESVVRNAPVKSILKKEKQSKPITDESNSMAAVNNEPGNEKFQQLASNILPKKVIDKIATDDQPQNMNVNNDIVYSIAPVQSIAVVPAKETSTNVSYIDNSEIQNDNYVFYDVKADNFKRSKVGGFFKRVKRVVARTNPIARLISGEDRQVASR